MLALAHVAPEIEVYFNNHKTYLESEKKIELLREKDGIYTSKLMMVQRDQDLLKRFHDKTFNVQTEQEIIYPQADPEKEQQAKLVLDEIEEVTLDEDITWQWLCAANHGNNRVILIISGAMLVLSAFVFLGGFSPNSKRITNEITKETESLE